MALLYLFSLSVFDIVALVEFVDSSRCRNKLLLAGIERMAIRAGIYLDFLGG